MGSTDEDPYKQIDLIGDGGLATIFISDIHIPDGKSKHKELLSYLVERQKDIDKVVLVGDLLDLWVSGIGNALSAASPFLNFLNDNYKGRVHYVLGNHDLDLLPLKGVFPFIHTSLTFPVGDKKGVCLHGNILDPDPYVKTKFSHYMAWFINKFDGWAKIDTRRSLVSLADRIKNDPYDKVLQGFEDNIVSSFRGKFDYVIVGHTHIPKFTTVDGVTIINCGDQLQHSTVVIAKKDGFYLYDYIAEKTLDVHRI